MVVTPTATNANSASWSFSPTPGSGYSVVTVATPTGGGTPVTNSTLANPSSTTATPLLSGTPYSVVFNSSNLVTGAIIPFWTNTVTTSLPGTVATPTATNTTSVSYSLSPAPGTNYDVIVVSTPTAGGTSVTNTSAANPSSITASPLLGGTPYKQVFSYSNLITKAVNSFQTNTVTTSLPGTVATPTATNTTSVSYSLSPAPGTNYDVIVVSTPTAGGTSVTNTSAANPSSITASPLLSSTTYTEVFSYSNLITKAVNSFQTNTVTTSAVVVPPAPSVTMVATNVNSLSCDINNSPGTNYSFGCASYPLGVGPVVSSGSSEGATNFAIPNLQSGMTYSNVFNEYNWTTQVTTPIATNIVATLASPANSYVLEWSLPSDSSIASFNVLSGYTNSALGLIWTSTNNVGSNVATVNVSTTTVPGGMPCFTVQSVNTNGLASGLANPVIFYQTNGVFPDYYTNGISVYPPSEAAIGSIVPSGQNLLVTVTNTASELLPPSLISSLYECDVYKTNGTLLGSTAFGSVNGGTVTVSFNASAYAGTTLPMVVIAADALGNFSQPIFDPYHTDGGFTNYLVPSSVASSIIVASVTPANDPSATNSSSALGAQSAPYLANFQNIPGLVTLDFVVPPSTSNNYGSVGLQVTTNLNDASSWLGAGQVPYNPNQAAYSFTLNSSNMAAQLFNASNLPSQLFFRGFVAPQTATP